MSVPPAPLRWGILGAGGIAATVGADIAASPGSVVAAVGSRDRGRAADLAARLGGPAGGGRAYGGYEELVADPDVDVVYVATTHAQHHGAALTALRSGKPVLVEKPVALNARQAREIAQTAQDRGLLCLEAMWLRVNPAVQAVQAIVAAGEIGELRAVRADLSHVFDYEPAHRLFDPSAGGGALLDLGVYPAALVWALLGRPDAVSAVGTLAPTGVDASSAMAWTYADGPVAQITCSSVTASGSTATLVGTHGWIELAAPLFRSEQVTVCDRDGGRTVRYPLPPGNGYGLEVAEVEHCLRTGATRSTAMPLDDGIGVLEMLDEARRQLGVRYDADEEN
ncbi:Gfo/Idh/MocA family protein [Cellulomonas hominis]